MNLLRRAVKAQTDNTKSCITGNGFDNHLIALHRVSSVYQYIFNDISVSSKSAISACYWEAQKIFCFKTNYFTIKVFNLSLNKLSNINFKY